jgi:hypothetical protein
MFISPTLLQGHSFVKPTKRTSKMNNRLASLLRSECKFPNMVGLGLDGHQTTRTKRLDEVIDDESFTHLVDADEQGEPTPCEEAFTR